MANDEGGTPDFFDDLDDLKLPSDDELPADLTGESTSGLDSEWLAGAPDVEAIQDGEPTAKPQGSEEAEPTAKSTDTESAEAGEKPAAAAEEVEEEKGTGKLPLYLALAGAIGVALLIVALGWLQVLHFSTALYFLAVGLICYAVWQQRATNTAYTVFLACALVAVLTAVYCLWLALARYEFDVKARNAKQRVSMRQPIQGPVTTTATAWPALVRLTNSAEG